MQHLLRLRGEFQVFSFVTYFVVFGVLMSHTSVYCLSRSIAKWSCWTNCWGSASHGRAKEEKLMGYVKVKSFFHINRHFNVKITYSLYCLYWSICNKSKCRMLHNNYCNMFQNTSKNVNIHFLYCTLICSLVFSVHWRMLIQVTSMYFSLAVTSD